MKFYFNNNLYQVIFFTVLSTISYDSSAKDINTLIDHKERTQIQAIRDDFNKSYSALGIEDVLEKHSFLASQLQDLKSVLVTKSTATKTLTDKLNKNIENGYQIDGLINDISSLSTEATRVNEQIKLAQDELNANEIRLNSLEKKVVLLKEHKNSQLLSVLKKIKSKLIRDRLIEHTELFSGKFSCDLRTSLKECVAHSKERLKYDYELTLIAGSSIVSFEITDASINLEGTVNYDARAKYTMDYDGELDALLRQELGLNFVTFAMRSNSGETKYYVNGEEIGNGKFVSISGAYNGLTEILASNGDRKQSVKDFVENGKEYYFPFSASASPSFDTKNVFALPQQDQFEFPALLSVGESPEGSFIMPYYLSMSEGRYSENGIIKSTFSFDEAEQVCSQISELTTIATSEQYVSLFDGKFLELYGFKDRFWTGKHEIVSIKNRDVVVDESFFNNKAQANFICFAPR